MFQRKIPLFLALAALGPCGLAQTSADFTSLLVPSSTVSSKFSVGTERHLQSPSAGILYSNSGFAHGFRHGYERGFQIGDLDFQMGRTPRVAFKGKEYQPSGHDYNPDFGSKQLFEEGYKEGFHRGYADAISGFEFRVTDQAKSAGAGLTEVLAPTRRHYFDEGFVGGFRSSQLKDAPVQFMSSDYLEQYCHKTASGPYAFEYCSGFSRGYIFGSSSNGDLKVAAAQPVRR